MVDNEEEIKKSEIMSKNADENREINEETEEEKASIRDFFDSRLDDLKKAVNTNRVIKGVREVLRNIEKKKVEKLYIALNDTVDGKYKDSLIKFVSQINLSIVAKKDESDKGNKQKEIEYYLVKDYSILRDVVMRGDLQFVNKLKGVKAKGPKCYCAAILRDPKENKKKSP